MKAGELVRQLIELEREHGELEIQVDALGHSHGVTQTPVDKVYVRGGKIIIEGEELAP